VSESREDGSELKSAMSKNRAYRGCFVDDRKELLHVVT
jgi:hypothetical protein